MWGSLVNWTIHVSPFVSVGIPQWVMKCAAFLLLFFMRDGDAVYPIQFNQVWFALCIKTAPILASRNTCAPVGGTHHYSIRLFQERTRGGWEISRERGRERGRWREKKRGRVREKKREEERERERERECVWENLFINAQWSRVRLAFSRLISQIKNQSVYSRSAHCGVSMSVLYFVASVDFMLVLLFVFICCNPQAFYSHSLGKSNQRLRNVDVCVCLWA